VVPEGEQTLLCRAGAVWIGQNKGSLVQLGLNKPIFMR
jgi:hypothetical protein